MIRMFYIIFWPGFPMKNKVWSVHTRQTGRFPKVVDNYHRVRIFAMSRALQGQFSLWPLRWKQALFLKVSKLIVYGRKFMIHIKYFCLNSLKHFNSDRNDNSFLLLSFLSSSLRLSTYSSDRRTVSLNTSKPTPWVIKFRNPC